MSLIINADGEYLSGSGTVFATAGLTEFTVAICVKRDVATAAYQSYMYLGREPTDGYGSIWIAHNGSGPDCFAVPSGASRRVNGGTGADTTNWQWVFETYKKDVEHKAYVAQVGGSVTSFTDAVPTDAFNADLDHIRIGLGEALADGWYPRCKLAQPVFWDVCLTPAQIADLVSGGSGGISKNPQAIAAANLKFYASLASDATVTVSGVSLAATGALTYDGADNPNVEAYGSTHNVTITNSVTANTSTTVAITSSAVSGTLTTAPLKNNAGTLLANETGATAYIHHMTTGALIVAKTGQTTNASGVMTVTDALIAPATQYRIVVKLASNAEGLDKLTAT